MALKNVSQHHSCNNELHGLTPKRQKVLKVLADAQKPLSAYEVVELYNETAVKPIHAMSVYRILDYLESVHLIVHLHSVNKFFAHDNEAEQASDSVCFYITCQQCCEVQKLPIDNNQAAVIKHHIHRLGYQLPRQLIEVPGLCNKCSPNANTTFKES